MNLSDFLSDFWKGFLELNAAEQVALVAGLIGIPSIGAFLVNLTRVGRLKKALDGCRAEVTELSRQVSDLNRRNCGAALEVAATLNHEEARKCLLGTTKTVSKELARAFEELSKLSYSGFYEDGDPDRLELAKSAARRALDLDEASVVAALLVDEGEIAEDETPLVPEGIIESIESGEAAERAMAIVVAKVSELLADFKDQEALQLARRCLFAIRKANLLGAVSGLYGCYAYIKAAIFTYDRVEPSPLIKKQMIAVSQRTMILSARYNDRNELAYFVNWWHHASVLRIVGRGQEVLSIVEGNKILDTTARLFGEGHNCSSAWRLLYTRTAAERGNLDLASSAVDELERHFAKHPRRDQRDIIKICRGLIRQRRRLGGEPMTVSSIAAPGGIRLL